MRNFSLGLLVLLPALALGACADEGGGGYRASDSGPRAANRSNDDFTKLQNDCESKGGILAPTGRTTQEPTLDNVCKLDPAAPPPAN